ncbi:MAG: MotA/TolQ/ExbB proton channel family protein [Candidatus Omnitrophica bacterium]|nr:MotA/TolQ/ExbB proton channel family protein [Candidatus Omnitrophota bacterium]
MVGRMVPAALFVGAALMIALLVFWQVDIIQRGGPVMIPIVMCSIFSLALILERFSYFLNLHLGTDMDRFLEQVNAAVNAHRWKDAQALCGASPGPVARVVEAGLAMREGPPQEIDEAMEEAAHVELPAVEQHLRWLSTLAQIATLLGLLGTVTGLVRAFQIIQEKASGGSPVSPGDLAGGVWEALMTTVAGLTVAIPTILAYNYFASRVGEVQFQMERAASIVSGWRRRGKAHAD